MNTTKRTTIAIAVVLLLAVAGGLYYLLDNLDAIVEDAIERHGSVATGTDVSVDSVEVSLQEGKATIRGLTVGNPDGFDEPYAFAWNEVSVDIDLESLRSAPPYVIEAVRIDAPQVVMAINEQGRINLMEIRDSLEAGSSEERDEPAPDAEPTRMRIDSLTFARGRTEVHTTEVGGKDMGVDLPALELEGLGGTGGAPPTEIAREALTAYVQQVVSTVARKEAGRRIQGALEDQLGEDGDQALESAKGFLDQLRGD